MPIFLAGELFRRFFGAHFGAGGVGGGGGANDNLGFFVGVLGVS